MLNGVLPHPATVPPSSDSQHPVPDGTAPASPHFSRADDAREKGESTMKRASFLRRRSTAAVTLLTSASLLAGLAQAIPARAADPLPDNPGSRITFGQGPRAARCETGFALHIGGPALKDAAMKALKGTDAELAAALY